MLSTCAAAERLTHRIELISPTTRSTRRDCSVVGLNRFAVVVRGRFHRFALGSFPLLLLIDLFFDSFPECSDSLRESNSLKEAFMGILRDRMIEEMKLRNFSPATQESYVTR